MFQPLQQTSESAFSNFFFFFFQTQTMTSSGAWKQDLVAEIELHSQVDNIISTENGQKVILFYSNNTITSTFNTITQKFTKKYRVDGYYTPKSKTLFHYDAHTNKLWTVAEYALRYLNLQNQHYQIIQWMDIQPKTYFSNYKYLVSLHPNVYLFSSNESYAILNCADDTKVTGFEGGSSDGMNRNGGKCIVLPKKQEIILLGGCADVWYDQVNPPILHISQYKITQQKWLSHNIELNLYEFGIFADKAEKYIYIFGGYRDRSPLQINGHLEINEHLNIIYRINCITFEIQKSTISCPKIGPCTVILMDNALSCNLLLHGYIKSHLPKNMNFPRYLIELAVKFVTVYNVLYVNYGSKECFTIDMIKLSHSFTL